MREIYLKPFQIAIKAADPWALMTACVGRKACGVCLSLMTRTDTIASMAYIALRINV